MTSLLHWKEDAMMSCRTSPRPSVSVLLLLLAALVTVLPAYDVTTHEAAAKRAIEILRAVDVGNLYAEIHDAKDGHHGVAVTGCRDENDSKIQGSPFPGGGGYWDNRKLHHFYDPATQKGLKWKWYCGEGGAFLNRFGFGRQVKKPEGGYLPSAIEWVEGLSDACFPITIEEYDYSRRSKDSSYYMAGRLANVIQEMAQPDYVTLAFNSGSNESGKTLRVESKRSRAEKVARSLVKILIHRVGDEGFLGLLISVFGFEFVFDEIMAREDDFTRFIWGTFTEIFKKVGGFAAVAIMKLAGFIFAAGAGEPTYAKYETARLLGATPEDQVGYERLVAEQWNFKSVPIPTRIDSFTGFREYYVGMASQSLGAFKANKSPLLHDATGDLLPLGVEYHNFALFESNWFQSFVQNVLHVSTDAFGPVPLIPTIAPGDEKPFLELATGLLPASAELSADFLRFFYKIVNHPPYAWKVIVEQPRGDTLYVGTWVPDAWEEPQQIHLVSRRLDVRRFGRVPRKMRCGIPAKVTICFTPINIVDRGPVNLNPVRKNMDQVSVEFAGLPLDGKLVSKDTWVCESFVFPCEMAKCVEQEIPLEIWATDGAPHYLSGKDGTRKFRGDLLDLNPATPAKADSAKPYNWIDYEPGLDTNHKLVVLPAFEIDTIYPDEQGVIPGNAVDYNVLVKSYAPKPVTLTFDAAILPSDPSFSLQFLPPVMTIAPPQPGQQAGGTAVFRVLTTGSTPVRRYTPNVRAECQLGTRCSSYVVLWVGEPMEREWFELLFDPPIVKVLEPSKVLDIRVFVRNLGARPVRDDYDIAAFIDGEPVFREQGPPIDPMKQVEVSFQKEVAVGEHVLELVVDPDNTVEELDEENNTLTVPVTVR